MSVAVKLVTHKWEHILRFKFASRYMAVSYRDLRARFLIEQIENIRVRKKHRFFIVLRSDLVVYVRKAKGLCPQVSADEHNTVLKDFLNGYGILDGCGYSVLLYGLFLLTCNHCSSFSSSPILPLKSRYRGISISERIHALMIFSAGIPL